MPPANICGMSDLILKIEDVAYGGDGVARHEGKVFFVPGTIPGEKVLVHETNSTRNFSRAIPVEVIEPSESRIESTCPYSMTVRSASSPQSYCAGCCYRHMTYERELSAKTAQLRDLLTRLAGLELMSDITATPAPASDRYRNKIVLHTADACRLGYVSGDKKTIIDIEDCLLAIPQISERLNKFRGSSEIKDATSRYRHVTFRYTQNDGCTVWCGAHPEKQFLTENTAAGKLMFHAASFAQVNQSVCDLLVEHVSSLTAQVAPERFIDIYCGTGLFAIAAAKAGVPQVLGVEVSSQAVHCARQNAASICPGQATFICAPAARSIRSCIQQSGDLRKTIILVDPPRRGLDPTVCEALKECDPLQLLYVSCAPDTMARDIKELTAAGYKVEKTSIFDMFPRTANFETVTQLRKRL